MADEENVLLDTFVRILPHPDNDKVLTDAINKTKAMFADVDKAASNAGRSSGGIDPAQNTGRRFEEGLRRAKIAARELAIEAGNIFKEIKGSAETGITDRFTQSLRELQKVKRDLSDNRGDPLALEAAQGRIERLRASLISLRVEGSRSVPIRRDFDELAASERKDRFNFGIETNLQSRFTKTLNVKERFDLAELISQAKQVDFEFDRLRDSFDGTAASLQRLQAQAQRGRVLRDAISGRLDEARLRPGGFNTNNLSNNAFQLGQAFEDAAVGFQLNGVSGAIRGAGNNISFLINNLSQMESIQNRLPGAWKTLLPLVGGVGVGLGIVIIPKMLEWLQELQEVEFKFKDIGDQIKRNVSDAEFDVGLDIGSAKFERDLKDAKDIEEVVKRTNDLIQKRDDNQKKIISTTEALEKSGAFERAASDIGAVIQLRQRRFEELGPKSTGIFGLTQSGIQPEKFKKEREQITKEIDILIAANEDLQKAQQSVAKGVPTSDADIQKARDSFDGIKKQLEEAKKVTDGIVFSGLSNEKTEQLKKSLAEVSEQLDKINKLSKENQEINNQNIAQGLQAIIDKNKELAFSIRLTQAEIEGTTFEGASKINELFEKNDKVRESVNESILEGLKNADPEVRKLALVAADAANFFVSSTLQNDLGARLKKAQDELKKSQSKSSTFTDFESFAKNLQTNVLSGDDALVKSQKDLKDEIRTLIEAIKTEREHFLQNGSKLFPLSDRTSDLNRANQLDEKRRSFSIPSPQEQFAAQQAAFAAALQMLMPPLFKIIESQDHTTDAVKNAGTVAQ